MAPVAASPTPPASPAPASTRPEGLPDTYWDATANALKVDPSALVKDLKERDELKAFKATEDSRRLTLPQKPEDFKVELPADFKPPEGVTFEFKKDDPLLAQAQTLAHQLGMTQDGFSKMLSVYAAAQVQDQAIIATARAAEVGKLGVNGPARVDAILNHQKAFVGEKHAAALAQMLVTAAHVEAFEAYVQKISTQGGAGFTQQHRSQPDPKTIPGYDKMSFEQRRFAQDQLARKTG